MPKHSGLTKSEGTATLGLYPYDRRFSMNGTIRCNKCFTNMTGTTCSKCGYPICYIYLYWKKKRYKFTKDKDDYQFDYHRANRLLGVIRLEIDQKTFNPDNYLPGKVKERLMENKLTDWLEQKSEEEQANEMSPETIRHYQAYVKQHFIPYFKGLDVKEVEFSHLENFKDKLPKRLKIKTRRNILNALHSFFRWLKRKGIIKEVPNFPDIKGNDAEVRTSIDIEQQREALNKIPGHHRDIFEFSFETGLRGGELCALKAKDIDIKKKHILVQRSFSGTKLRETTKTNRKIYLPLSDKALEIAKRNVKDKAPDAFLFINERTQRHYTTMALWQNWRKYSGIEVSFYEASRHSFITQLVEDNVNPLVARELARHTNIQTTQKYYHATATKLRDIVNNRGKVVPIGGDKVSTDEVKPDRNRTGF
ncbi:Integrase, catalytic core, phage domain protein [Candidatus Magnetobacterium bavaricum]|uniref:Integrase, catalytic core, phage domain protein n=1 Tax=Candidatus Magnetobacterium bavaricum TaxID=29290 RepID=A0A0F3H3G5_9BACT|nr:Integrase, catalytic core, phage domain protein [Candidatus Magnetobacterium bavaricum]